MDGSLSTFAFGAGVYKKDKFKDGFSNPLSRFPSVFQSEELTITATVPTLWLKSNIRV